MAAAMGAGAGGHRAQTPNQPAAGAGQYGYQGAVQNPPAQNYHYKPREAERERKLG